LRNNIKNKKNMYLKSIFGVMGAVLFMSACAQEKTTSYPLMGIASTDPTIKDSPASYQDVVNPEQMQKLCETLREEFDYILIDCPAGIEQGFKNAVAGADKAIVVTTPEVSAVRDADRIIGLLEAAELRNPLLILNRIRPDMVKRGDMMALEDVTEILAVDILGIVPDDESIVISTNRGEPCVADSGSRAGLAYRNITRRILGEEVPLMDLYGGTGFFGKLKKMFRGGK